MTGLAGIAMKVVQLRLTWHRSGKRRVPQRGEPIGTLPREQQLCATLRQDVLARSRRLTRT